MLNRQYLINVTPTWARPVAQRLARRNRERRRASMEALSEADVRKVIRDVLGIGTGDVVFVHSAAGNLNLGFPFYRVIDILQEVVGEQGTLLFPTTQHEGRAADFLRRGETFDVRRTPTTMGVIAEFARRRAGAIRSLHPTNSIAAIGPHAEDLTKSHHESIYPCGKASPYFRMMQHGGRVMGLGVGCENLAFVHVVEDVLKEAFPVETREAEPYRSRVRDADGRDREVETLVAHKRIAWRDIRRYLTRHVDSNAYREIRHHGRTFFVADTRRLFDRMCALAHEDRTIYARFVYRSCWLSRWT